MAGLPSHVFVVRHGNRLDAADKQWHLTSPTPYDPPLTYGGWLQARQVGNQIRNYLEQAKLDEAPSSRSAPAASASGATTPPPKPKPKRYRIVIHSSPFLRCIQTSVGISAGLAQTAPDASYSPADLIVPAPSPPGKPDAGFRSSVLRLDSFLGEWLSPDYFDNITPPPSSSLMLGTAKADLLRREDYSSYTDFAPVSGHARKGSLWSASPTTSNPGLVPSAPEGDDSTRAKNSYNPPRPTYAISTTGPIPDGFVPHARDHCVAVDYQWDSMREPLDCGDGGSLGEEWSSMHHRFRHGVKRMLNWYATADAPEEMVSSPASRAKSQPGDDEGSDDETVETVVVIVSHGAGCNALIGAITHQPVLMDVALASLTMAVRRSDLSYQKLMDETRAREASRPQSRDPRDTKTPQVPVHDLYEMRLSASTEHLRASSSTPVSVSSPPTASSNIWHNGPRGRTSTIGSLSSTPPNLVGPSLGAFVYSDNTPGRSSPTSASPFPQLSVSTRRESPLSRRVSRPSILTGSNESLSGNNSSTARNPSPTLASPATPGLWSPAPSSLRFMDDNEDKDDYAFPDFDQKRFKSPPPSSAGSVQKSLSGGPVLAGPIRLQTNWDGGKVPEEVTVAKGEAGLWGQPRAPEEMEPTVHDGGHTKRRWTVSSRPQP